MADVNANIGVNIDTSDALNQLKNLQRQISQFHQSVAKSSSTAAIAQRDLQRNFVNSVNAIQGFSAELRTVRTSAESFTNSLQKNKFSMREYFRYAAGATQTFGRRFGAEFSTIEKTAIERVKTLQTQYIKMGRDAQGAMQAIAIRPTVLNMQDLGTKTAIAAQKQVLFNQLVKQGSTNLLNFGKNTQWAGRQLMVGFTLPLATLGMTAGRVFMDMEKAAIKFKKVYGDLFTAPEETQKAMDQITELGLAYTKYGVAVSDSLSVAADAAAAGFQGVDLQNQTTASLKLSVLGQMDLQKSLETTIALQNAFRISSNDLVGTIDFLNAVENQTVVSLDDITEATPRVATVIQALGGDVKDLAFFLAAMKEGGVNAAQGANALKSGLASLINPTERASELLLGMGVNIRGIVSENQGDLRGTVLGFARALDQLDPMRRAQAIEQLFGKFQFARISALFDNVIRDGSQASRVLDLAGSSLEDLANLSEKELGVQAASSMNKFTSAIERIKVALVPLGQLFLDIATPFIDFGTKVLDAFNALPNGVRQAIGTVITVVGGLGPVLLMTFGLINNGIANMVKFFATVRLGYLKMTGQAKGIGDETQYMTQEQLEASAAAASLDQAHSNLTQRFTAEKVAVDALRDAYSQAVAAGARFAMINPGMMKPGAKPTKMAKGGVVTVGGRGNRDTEPALLTPGEAVIPAEMAKKYAPIIQGMIAGNIPGYQNGRGGAANFGGNEVTIANARSARALQDYYDKLIQLNSSSDQVNKMFANLVDAAEKNKDGLVVLTRAQAEQAAAANKDIALRKSGEQRKLVLGHLQGVKSVDPATGERTMGSLTRRVFQDQNVMFSKTGQPIEEFSKDWKAVTGGLNESVELGGVQLTESVKKTAQAIDDQIYDATIKLANGTKITDQILEDATSQVLDTAEKAGGEMARVSAALKKVRDNLEFEVNAAPTAGTRRAAGLQRPNESELQAMNRMVAEKNATLEGRNFKLTSQGMAAGISSTAELGRLSSSNQFRSRQRVAATPGNRTYLDRQSKDPSLKGVSVDPAVANTIVKNIKSEIGQELQKASQSRSPSEETIKATNNMVDGVTETLVNSKDDVARATETMVSPVTGKTRGPRRASDNPAVMAALAANPSQVAGQARRNSREPRRATRPADNTATTVVNENLRKNTSDLSDKMSKAALGLSSLTGILFMFGGELSAVSGVISMVSAGLFGLIQVTDVLRGLQIKEFILAKAQAVADAVKLATTAAAATGLGAFATVTSVASAAMTALLGPIGLIALGVAAVAAVLIGLGLIVKNQMDKMAAFGKIVDVTADQVKFLGERAGEVVITETGFDTATAAASEEVNTAAAKQRAEDEEFQTKFATQIQGAKDGAKKSVEDALDFLAFQLSSSGLSDKVVTETIAGIVRASKRTDIEFDFANVGVSKANTDALINSFKSQAKNVKGIDFLGTATADVGKSFASLAKSFSLQLQGEQISLEEYNRQLGVLRDSLSLIENDSARGKAINAAVDGLISDEGLREQIKSIEDLDKRFLLLQASGGAVNLDLTELIKMAGNAAVSNEDLAKAIQKRTAAQIESNKASNQQVDLEEITEEASGLLSAEITAINNKITAYGLLTKAGYDTKTALELLNNETLVSQLVTEGNVDGIKTSIDDLLEARKKLDAITGGGGGGAAQKSPFQQAIENLQNQRKEIKNNIVAFAKLRKSGFGVSEALDLSADSATAAALASQKFGSQNYNNLIRQIKAVKKAQDELLRSTPQGRTQLFNEAFDKVTAYFDSQEALLRAQTDAATASNRALIERLEAQIEVYQRQIDDFQRDLDEIAEKEDEINKAYDEKAKALETVKKLNQDIINQQKSQLSIADALSRGDISAAASAMQDARAQNAAAQGDAATNALDAARQAQLNAITVNGLNREQIEARIKQIKKDIAEIEFGALRNARDAVDAAEKALEKAISALTYRRKTREQWELEAAAVDAAEKKVLAYEKGVYRALKDSEKIVKAWEKLNDTFTTTHIVNTVYNGTPAPGAADPDPAPKKKKKTGGGPIIRRVADGGFISGPGTATSDSILAMLSDGEYVIKAASVDKFGKNFLDLINAGKLPEFKLGGMAPKLSSISSGSFNALPKPTQFNKPVYSMPERNYADLGSSEGIYEPASPEVSSPSTNNSVYNYNLSVNVEGTDASANDIANEVMSKIKSIQSQQVRKQVLR
jgi:TP901 family phage tail tape measure protein